MIQRLVVESTEMISLGLRRFPRFRFVPWVVLLLDAVEARRAFPGDTFKSELLLAGGS
jgi:hypothetical protein